MTPAIATAAIADLEKTFAALRAVIAREVFAHPEAS
jgi:hypothetical protein